MYTYARPRTFCIMSQRVNLRCEVKFGKNGAVAKASLNRANSNAD